MPVMRKTVKKYQEGGHVSVGNPSRVTLRRGTTEDVSLTEQETFRQNEPAATAGAERDTALQGARGRRPRRAARDPQAGMADELNARVLHLTRGGAPRDEVDRRLASAMGLAFKKGGAVKSCKKK